MITLFSVPKAFEGRFAVIQENAIQSWLSSIKPRPEIILLGNEKGIKEISKKYNLLHIPLIKKNIYGTPLLGSIFEKAYSKAQNNILMYCNTDIIITDNVISISKPLIKRFKSFLAAGRRYELNIEDKINFDRSQWRNLLRKQCNGENMKNSAWLDYFIFPKRVFDSIPSFALGKTFWDKWLVWKVSSLNVPVVDITKSFTAIHQSHDYSYGKRDITNVWEGEEAYENVRLGGGWSHGYTLNDADYLLENSKIVRLHKSPHLVISHRLKTVLDKTPFIWPLLFKIRRIKNRL